MQLDNNFNDVKVNENLLTTSFLIDISLCLTQNNRKSTKQIDTNLCIWHSDPAYTNLVIQFLIDKKQQRNNIPNLHVTLTNTVRTESIGLTGFNEDEDEKKEYMYLIPLKNVANFLHQIEQQETNGIIYIPDCIIANENTQTATLLPLLYFREINNLTFKNTACILTADITKILDDTMQIQISEALADRALFVISTEPLITEKEINETMNELNIKNLSVNNTLNNEDTEAIKYFIENKLPEFISLDDLKEILVKKIPEYKSILALITSRIKTEINDYFDNFEKRETSDELQNKKEQNNPVYAYASLIPYKRSFRRNRQLLAYLKVIALYYIAVENGLIPNAYRNLALNAAKKVIEGLISPSASHIFEQAVNSIEPEPKNILDNGYDEIKNAFKKSVKSEENKNTTINYLFGKTAKYVIEESILVAREIKTTILQTNNAKNNNNVVESTEEKIQKITTYINKINDMLVKIKNILDDNRISNMAKNNFCIYNYQINTDDKQYSTIIEDIATVCEPDNKEINNQSNISVNFVAILTLIELLLLNKELEREKIQKSKINKSNNNNEFEKIYEDFIKEKELLSKNINDVAKKMNENLNNIKSKINKIENNPIQNKMNHLNNMQNSIALQ